MLLPCYPCNQQGTLPGPQGNTCCDSNLGADPRQAVMPCLKGPRPTAQPLAGFAQLAS